MRESMGNAHRTGGPARSLGDSAHAACGTLLGVTTALVSEGGLHELAVPRIVIVVWFVPLLALVVLLAGTAVASRASQPR